MAAFAKYDGIDGESDDANHGKWIDVLSIDWGAHKPGGGMTGQSRRRGAAVVEDMALTVEYENAAPKLQEKCLEGEVIPKLEVERTATYGGGASPNRLPPACQISKPALGGFRRSGRPATRGRRASWGRYTTPACGRGCRR